MKRVFFLSVAMLSLLACRASAQGDGESTPTPASPEQIELTSGAVEPTSEMWFYLQELKRANDSDSLVQQNAQMRGAQRRNRIAALQWYGMSNQRPQANVTPFYGTYSPVWTGGSTDAYRWSRGGYRSRLIGPRPPSVHR